MTPQSSFMVLAPVAPAREAELRRLLAGMNEAPGRVDPRNALVPFAQFDTLHVARFLILDDKTLDDGRVYGLPRPHLSAVPGVSRRRGRPYGCVPRGGGEARPGRAPDDLLVLRRVRGGWRSRRLDEAPQRSVRGRITSTGGDGRCGRFAKRRRCTKRSNAMLQSRRRRISTGLQPREIHEALAALRPRGDVGRAAVAVPGGGDPARGADPQSGEPARSAGGAPGHLAPVIPARASLLRSRLWSSTDPVLCHRVDRGPFRRARRSWRTMTSPTSSARWEAVKPGIVRRWLTKYVLWVIDYGARHLFTRGRLARVRSIHFARWVFLDDRQRIAFFSNYDGSLESYMDDFINKVGFGLNVVVQQWHRISQDQLARFGRLRGRAQLQGVSPPPPAADPGLVQGLSGSDGDRPGKEPAHSAGTGIVADERSE